ncbi:MAG: hypothetical protein JXA96_00100 [Sedimentisphaerales bacterium]|nr:hypothetical protein [Sedimentisphaerales bacterium]
MVANTENAEYSKKPKKYFLLAISICLAFIPCSILFKTIFYKSPEEQLAAIEASLAIPNSENAAIYYNAFLTDSNNIAILNNLKSYLPAITNYTPWQSDNDPNGSVMLRKYNLFIKNIVEISKIPEARFSFNINDFLSNRIYSYLRNITVILSWAGANDIGDGRIDEAINKFISQVLIAGHLNQQPMRIYKQVGIGIESVGLKNIRDITMYKDITEEQLLLLDKIISNTQNFIGQDKKLEDKVNSLHKTITDPTKNYPFISRIKVFFTSYFSRRQNEKIWKENTFRLISLQRASRIMIALRLYQKQNSKWPETLDEIKSSLSPENFTDEMNNSSFVYRLSGDSFVLYSKGPDNIDNNHQKSSDDIVYWFHAETQVTEKQTADPNE